jgi:lysophospholipase L1-like esterase
MITQTRFGTRLLSRFGALSLLTVGLLVGVTAAPAVSAPRPSMVFGASAGDYVALGDSFTAGQGAPPYLPGPCFQSRYTSYPAIAGALSPYRLAANKACSGADTSAVLSQLPAIGSKTALVTLTVGGIDAGSNVVLAACAPDPTSPVCANAINASLLQLRDLAPKLVSTYLAVATAAPQARVVVMNYPLLFASGISPLGDTINGATAALNGVIAAAVGAATVVNPHIQFLDVTPAFANHGIGSAVPYISYDPAHPAAPANFHPNALGDSMGYYRVLATHGLLGITFNQLHSRWPAGM